MPNLPNLIAPTLLALIPAADLFAHSGGLNSEGCHNDRKNGGYHCHRAAAPSVAPQPAYDAGGGSELYYPNCAAARAAGVAPIYYGEPGYRGALDRDRDGVACE